MAAAILSRLRSTTAGFGAVGAARSYCEVAPSTLFLQLFKKDDPNTSLVPDLDQWVADGNNAPIGKIKHAIRDLRKRHRFKQALEVSEWMGGKGAYKFASADYAVQLDLIARVQGMESAEEYFNGLTGEHKKEKAYGCLLNCYVRELKMESSLSLLQKMKKMGFASSALPYNNIMTLYANSKQHEKVPLVLKEMKQNGILPNNFSYKICINSYGAKLDIEGVETTLEEMESQSHLTMDWDSYSMVANIYIKAKLPEKAISALKRTEEMLADTRYWQGYGYLISLYGSLGNKYEVNRIWELLKNVCSKLTNKDYIVMLDSLGKVDELEVAESLLKEWQKSTKKFDIRVPNKLLAKYCEKGMTEKGEALLKVMMRDGKVTIPNSFSLLSGAFEEKGEMKKSVELMISAFSCFPGNEGWKPPPELISSLLSWLGDEGELAVVESFIGMLRSIIPMNKKMYLILIKANMRSGKKVTEVLESMKADNIELDEESQKILGISQ